MKFFFKQKRIMIAVMGCFLAALVVAAGFASHAAFVFAEEKTPYASNEIIVTFQDGIDETEAVKQANVLGAEELSVIDTDGPQVAASITLPEGQEVEQAVKVYNRSSAITHAQPNYRYEGMAKTAATINDTYGSELWHFDKVQVEGAWRLLSTIEHKKVRVAVLDTGVDLNHPDLQKNLNKKLCADVCSGAPLPLGSGDFEHGTHVTGIMGATANNKLGVAGVGSGSDNSISEVFVVDVFEDDGAYTDDLVAGMTYAVEQGAKVINMSLTMRAQFDPEIDTLLENAIHESVQAGTTVVCAAGNSGMDRATYPSDFKDCIGVIATDEENQRWEDSDYGDEKDLSAPGTYIYSTYTGPDYQYKSGTSMAAPVVSSTAAMLYSIQPDITVAEVKENLYETATDLGVKGKDAETGYGLVNAYKAVNRFIPEKPTNIKQKKQSLTWRVAGRQGSCQVKIYKGKTLVFDSGEMNRTSCKIPNLKPGSYTIRITSINKKSNITSPAALYRYKVSEDDKSESTGGKKTKANTGVSTPSTADDTNVSIFILAAFISLITMLALLRSASRENR